MRGISTNDFSEVLSSLLGSEVSLSAASVVRLKESWHQEFSDWNKRDLSDKKYVYWWVDGVYFNVRLENERGCILVIIGATETGEKELLAVHSGYQESEISWLEVLRDLKSRGLSSAPKLVTGDGALGFWKAMTQEYPEARGQRCWVHKTANVLDKMPKKYQPSAKQKIHEIYLAASKTDALKAFDKFVSTYQAKYSKAVECLIKDKETTLSFYDFPAEHWQHIRSTNPIESTFATVRLRTHKTKGSGSLRDATAMVFKLSLAAQKRWRRLRGHKKIPLVMAGKKFKDGLLEVDA